MSHLNWSVWLIIQQVSVVHKFGLQYNSCLCSQLLSVSPHTNGYSPPFLNKEQVFFEKRETVLISHQTWCNITLALQFLSPHQAEPETYLVAVNSPPFAALPGTPWHENRTRRRKQLQETALKRSSWKPLFIEFMLCLSGVSGKHLKYFKDKKRARFEKTK